MTDHLTRNFKINGLPTPKELKAMPFGRQIDHLKVIRNFKDEAKSGHVSIKRRKPGPAIKEAIALHNAKEWYCEYHDSEFCRDDSFQFWYR